MDEVERLRRVAYGPGSSVQERAEAEAALRAIEAQAAEEESPAAVPAPGGVAGPAESAKPLNRPADSGGDGGADSVDGWAERKIRSVWVVPIAVCALVVGAVGALGATGQLWNVTASIEPTDSPEEPAKVQQPADGSDSSIWGGDLEAADAWFDGPATASDAYPHPELLESSGLDPYDVRFALSGGGGWNVWVGRSNVGDLCLLVADRETDGTAVACASRADFAAGGLHLGVNDRTVDWYGSAPTEGASTAPDSGTVPQIPGSGPGNVGRAAEWFAEPGTAYDRYPYPDALGALGIGDGDIVALDPAPGMDRIIWLARQGTTGFCLLVTDAVVSTRHYACLPVDVFRTSGIGIAFEGFAAYWDGESVASSG